MIRKNRKFDAVTKIALSALLFGLFWPGFAGAADFASLHDGSWFDAPNTWGQASYPGSGDNVWISTVVSFDSTTTGQSVTVSNLDMESGTLNLSGPALLGMAGTNSYWNNANLEGSSSLLQLGSLTLAGNNAIGWIGNQGVVHQGSIATLTINLNGHFDNEFGGTYDLQGDYPIVIGGGGGGEGPYFSNAGLLRKSGGIGITAINVAFNNENGAIEVDSGTLSLSGGGSSSSGAFTVAAGAVLDLTGGSGPTWGGLVTGSGAGQVQLNSGSISGNPSLTLNLPPGLFQWSGGAMDGTVINNNVITISGSCAISRGGILSNSGFLCHTNTATLAVTSSSHLENLTGGTYDLQTDGNIGQGGGPGADPYFDNYGLLRKSGGLGTSTIGLDFNNQSGAIEVDTGTLSLANNGASSNGTFTVSAGAALDLTGGWSPTWAGVINGSGAGQVQLSGGVINIDTSLTLNLPDGLFQWTGGWLQGTVNNSNVVTIAGSNLVALAGGFYNSSLLRHTNTATQAVRSNAHFENLAGGTYDLEGDGNIGPGGGGGADPYFNNYGLLRKSGGLGTSAISIFFYNQNGAIEVDNGVLSVNSYLQGTGTLTVKLGGRSAGQFGQLAVSGGASLGGPLNVTLANGFAPVPGDQFQILSCSGLSGAFSSTNVPAGMSVSYSNNGVYLIVPPMQILNPLFSGGNLIFSFSTVSNQSYTIQRNDDLATTNWVFYTNFTGNGSLLQLVAPVTNAPQRYFRLRQP